jgi:hypothetical protein
MYQELYLFIYLSIYSKASKNTVGQPQQLETNQYSGPKTRPLHEKRLSIDNYSFHYK